MHTGRNRPLTRKLGDEFPSSPLPSDQKREQRVEDFARNILMRNPRVSVDQLARMCSEQFRGRGIPKLRLSRVRHEVRQLKGLEPEPNTNILPKVDVAPKPPVAVPPRAEPPVQTIPTAHLSSTKGERTMFFESWALDHPTASLAQAHAAAKERFGMSIGALEAAAIMRQARELHTATALEAAAIMRQAPPAPPPVQPPPVEAAPPPSNNISAPDLRLVHSSPPVAVPPEASGSVPSPSYSPFPSSESVHAIVRTLQAHGIRKIEVLADGKYHVEVEGRLP